MASRQQKGFRFKAMILAAGGIVEKLSAPVGNIAQRHFETNFVKQGFVDSSTSKWKNVQRRIPGTKAYKYGTTSSRTRPILIGPGTPVLSRSIRYTVLGKGKIRVAVMGKATKYAGYINSGTSKMTKRQFIGRSRALDKQIVNRVQIELSRVFS
jgi:hypothetical protein